MWPPLKNKNNLQIENENTFCIPCQKLGETSHIEDLYQVQEYEEVFNIDVIIIHIFILHISHYVRLRPEFSL